MGFPKFLKIAVQHLRDVLEIKRNQTNHWEITGGIDGFLLKDLSKTLDFDYELYVPEDGEYGRINSDGKWTGILGMLDRGEVDMGFGSMFVTEKRYNSFAQILFTTCQFTFATNKPSFHSAESRFDYPFQTEVWITCFIAYLFTTAVLWIFSRRNCSICESAVETLRIILRQNTTMQKSRPSVSTNAVLGSWILASMLLSYSYSVILLSFMTLPPQSKGIKTIEELANAVEKQNYKVLAPDNLTPLVEVVRRNSKLHAIAQKILDNHWYFKVENGSYPQQLDSKTALVSMRLYFQVNYGVEPFTTKFISSDAISYTYAGLAVSKTFCWIDELRRFTNRMVESGLYNYYRQQRITRAVFDRTFEMEDSPVRPLSLHNLKAIFYILAYGLLLAFIALLFEMYYIRLYNLSVHNINIFHWGNNKNKIIIGRASKKIIRKL